MNILIICVGEKMLPRKVITASISSALFAILLGFVFPNPFQEQVVAEQNYFYSASTIINIYLMYSFPVILFFGILTSIASDRLAVYMLKKKANKKNELIVSGVFHVAFGLVLLPYSLGASILFFITDKLLQKRHVTFHSLQAVISLLIPLTVWLISLGIVWID